jgi:hypothetical protein
MCVLTSDIYGSLYTVIFWDQYNQMPHDLVYYSCNDQPVLPLCQEGENTNFVVFFIQPGIKPMIYYTPDEKANHCTKDAVLKIFTVT